MTHRHKLQTDEYELEIARAKMTRLEDAYQLYIERKRECRTLNDSNHGSRTDSNTRGGKA